MRAYESKKSRATKKRRGAKKKTPRVKKSEKPVAKKRGTAKLPLSRKPAAKGRGAKSPQARRGAKRPAATKSRTRTHKRKRGAEKPLSRKQRLAVERAATAKRLARLEKDRQRLRRKKKPRGKKTPAELRKRKREIEKRRLERKLVIEKLPQKTPTEKRKSREELYARLRKRFKELLEIAERTGQTPPVDYRKRKIRTSKNLGEIRVVRVEEQLTPGNVEEIMYKVEQAAKSIASVLPNWIAVLVFAGLGERLIGYGSEILKANDPDAASFQTQGIETTGVLTSRESMIRSVRETLEDLSMEGKTVVYLYHVKVMTYERLRTR